MSATILHSYADSNGQQHPHMHHHAQMQAAHHYPALQQQYMQRPPQQEQQEDWALVDFLLTTPAEDNHGAVHAEDSTPTSISYQTVTGISFEDEKHSHPQQEMHMVTLAPFDIDFSSLRPYLNTKHLDYVTQQVTATMPIYEQMSHHALAQHQSYHLGYPHASCTPVMSAQDSLAAAYAAKLSPMVTTLEGVANMVRIGQHKEKVCSVADCGKLARSRGLCMRHGGGRRCEVDGCQKGSQSGGRCIAHGGGKRCRTAGCLNAQQSEGLCIAHGGGKRCVVPGCNKSSQRRGYCHVHGGGQSCTINNCSKGAQRNGLCVEHGGRRYCKSEKCQKTARGGGYCIAHGGDTRCRAHECNKIAKEDGLCTLHLWSPKNGEPMPDSPPTSPSESS